MLNKVVNSIHCSKLLICLVLLTITVSSSFATETDYVVNAETVYETIIDISSETPCNIVVKGEITEDTLNSIVEALKNNEVAQINLDLSKTTGLKTIKEEAFYGCKSLTGMIIPKSVTTIEVNAFASCKNLTSITIQSGESSVEDYAFWNCPNLKTFNIDNNNKVYKVSPDGKMLLSKDSKTLIAFPSASGNVTIPSGVEIIGNGTFACCVNLIGVSIPNTVTSIGEAAFFCCENLTDVTIPNTVTSIEKQAFEYCKKLTSVTIPNSVTSIGDYAFSNCNSLTSVTIPNSVTSIGEYAFYYCDDLTIVTIPNSVTSIGVYAFGSCDILKTFNVDSNNKAYKSSPDGKMLLSKDGKTLLACPSASGNVTIPSEVEIINRGAFYCCSLRSVSIPSSVISIGKSAFNGCKNLTSITIPSGVSSIVDYAFGRCKKLKTFNVDSDNKDYISSSDGTMLLSKDGKTLVAYPSASGNVTIPSGIVIIGNGAFNGCSLSSVTIPSSVTSIGQLAFYLCENLTSVTFKDPDNWYYTDNENYIDGEEITEDLSNSTTAGQYLTSSIFYLYKK